MIFSFIFFLVLFLGGIWLMAFAQTMEEFQAIAFCLGLLITTLSIAWMMREGGSATRRSRNWSGPAAE